MSSNTISRWDLKPGQWVIFDHLTSPVPNQLQGPFKVINRDDYLLDHCRCFLMSIAGNILDYCPRMETLDYKALPWGYSVRVVDSEEIASQVGERMDVVQQMAINHLKRLARSEFFGRGFDPTDNNGGSLSGPEIQMRYGSLRK